MLGLGTNELAIVGGLLFMMLMMFAVVGAIVFVIVKLASGSRSSDSTRRITELEQQVAELQNSQNRHNGN